MTNAQMLAECRRLAPSFELQRVNDPDNGPLVAGSFVLNGKPFELSMIDTDSNVERVVLQGCLETIRRFAGRELTRGATERMADVCGRRS